MDGATWGHNGFIYIEGLTFGGDSTRGIMRVSAADGTPELVTTINIERGETDHIWPEALPNGKSVLLTINYGTGTDDADIALVDLPTGDYRVVVDGGAAKYAASGHLLYVTADGSLMAPAFDQDRGEVTGEATTMIEGLRIRAFGSVDLSLSETGMFAYVAEGVGSYDVTPDDEGFVMIRQIERGEVEELIVVENFFAELKVKVVN